MPRASVRMRISCPPQPQEFSVCTIASGIKKTTPTLAAPPLRCPPRGCISTLGAALRVSLTTPTLGRVSSQRKVRLVALEPALEDQQHPEPHRMVLAAAGVLGEQPLDRPRPDQSAAREPVAAECGGDRGLQLVREPVLERHHEALLR